MAEGGKSYEVELVVKPKGHEEAQKQAEKLSKAYQNLAEVAGSLRGKILGTAAGLAHWTTNSLGVQIGLFEMVKGSYEANIEMGRMQRNIAGSVVAFSNWKKGISDVTKVQAGLKEGKKVFDELEEAEYKLATPVEELGGAYRYLAGPVMQKFGGSSKDVIKLTTGAAAAAKVLGSDVGSVGMSITRLLETRTLRGIDPTTNFLRGMLGNTKDLHKMRPDKLLALVNEKLTGLIPAGEEMSKSLGGTMFRIKDFFEDTLRDIGGPTFKFLADRVEDWRKKLMATVGEGKTLADVYGEKVLRVFKAVGSVVETLANNWKTIALVLAGLKMGDVLKTTEKLSGVLGAVGKGGGILGSLAKNADVAGLALGALAAGLQLLADWIDGWQDKQLKSEAVAGGVLPGLEENLKRAAVGDPLAGRIAGQLIRGKQLVSAAGVMSQPMLDEIAKLSGTQGLPDYWAKLIRESGVNLGKPQLGTAAVAGGAPSLEGLTKPGKAVINFNGGIHIDQKFEEADPDNVFVQFQKGLQDAAENRMTAAGSELLAPT